MKKYIMSYQEHIQLLSEQKKQSENPSKEEDNNKLSSTDIPRIYRGNPSTGKIDDTPLRQGDEPVQKKGGIIVKSGNDNRPIS